MKRHKRHSYRGRIARSSFAIAQLSCYHYCCRYQPILPLSPSFCCYHSHFAARLDWPPIPPPSSLRGRRKDFSCVGPAWGQSQGHRGQNVFPLTLTSDHWFMLNVDIVIILSIAHNSIITNNVNHSYARRLDVFMFLTITNNMICTRLSVSKL